MAGTKPAARTILAARQPPIARPERPADMPGRCSRAKRWRCNGFLTQPTQATTVTTRAAQTAKMANKKRGRIS